MIIPVQNVVVQPPVENPLFAAADGGLFPVEAPPPAKLWKGTVEAGVNGSTGNTEVLNIRGFATGDRKTDTNLLHTDLTYLLGKQNGMTNQNTMIANVRDDILFPGSPWSLYSLNFFDYDENRDYKTQIGMYGGVGYLVSDTESLYFRPRLGFGTIYKTGAHPPKGDLWEPSLDIGYDYKRKFSERSALISTMDYYPSLDKGFDTFLLRLRIAYEVTLDPETGTFFRIGMFERYDSNPGPGTNRSDLNYFMAFGFNL